MEEVESLKVGSAIDDAIDSIGAVYERMPVRNQVPRTEPEENRALWGALMKRGGGKCWMCGRADGFMVIDHLTPRSAFTPETVHIADRSDNLAIACWDCNTDKSNQDRPFRRPLGVAWYCPSDWTREGVDQDTQDEWLEYYSADDKQVFCARHGCVMTVPADWSLASLT